MPDGICHVHNHMHPHSSTTKSSKSPVTSSRVNGSTYTMLMSEYVLGTQQGSGTEESMAAA